MLFLPICLVNKFLSFYFNIVYLNQQLAAILLSVFCAPNLQDIPKRDLYRNFFLQSPSLRGLQINYLLNGINARNYTINILVKPVLKISNGNPPSLCYFL